MITIIIETKDEYYRAMKIAKDYVCKQMSFTRCGQYPPGFCDKCFEDNHIKCGVRIIPPVDSDKPNKL